jgi:hypothetical protein
LGNRDFAFASVAKFVPLEKIFQYAAEGRIDDDHLAPPQAQDLSTWIRVIDQSVCGKGEAR